MQTYKPIQGSPARVGADKLGTGRVGKCKRKFLIVDGAALVVSRPLLKSHVSEHVRVARGVT